MRVEWEAPANVGAFCSTRDGGVSSGPYASLNLGIAVDDDPQAVAENRRRFAAAIGSEPVWLRQVHGTRVVHLGRDDDLVADAAWTDAPGRACVVQVADCLPVLLARADGRAVGAAHAGWRGLAGGVVEATLQAMGGGEVVAWLGPCIGPRRFEVGDDVRAAFPGDDAHFTPVTRADGSPGWLAELPALARARLARAGVTRVAGGEWCTVDDPSRFFSFRRDRITGRLAAAVWLRG
jgi:YfiH family protein